MRTMLSTLVLGVILMTGPAMAQPACPTDVAATIAAACPCGADAEGQAWLNHGKYVSCIVRQRNDLRRQGCLDSETQRTIARCASRSTCGKEGAVLCCTYDTSGVCTPAGTCSNDAAIACLTDTDCITTNGPKVKRRAETCTLHGGIAVGEGSVCAGCPAVPPSS